MPGDCRLFLLTASCSRQPSLDDVLERLPSEDLLLERPRSTATAAADAIADAATARVLVSPADYTL